MEIEYWNSFYRAGGPNRELSGFASSVDQAHEKKGTIIEFGCGDGTDAIGLARRGWEVIASDGSVEGIEKAKSRAREYSVQDDQLRFSVINVSAPEELQKHLQSAQLDSRREPVLIFTRFFLHSLADEELDTFIIGLSAGIENPITMAHEFRTPEDSSMPKAFSNHSRIFRSPETVLDAFSKHFEISKVSLSQGSARAVYREDDARVAWVIFSSATRRNHA